MVEAGGLSIESLSRIYRKTTSQQQNKQTNQSRERKRRRKGKKTTPKNISKELGWIQAPSLDFYKAEFESLTNR